MSPSWLNQRVAVEATTMDWASIILPITPPELLAAPMRLGDRPSCSAATFCMPPKSTLLAVSEPVMATPIHPIRVPKKGYSAPVPAKARPRVVSVPEKRVSVPRASISRSEEHTSELQSPKDLVCRLLLEKKKE